MCTCRFSRGCTCPWCRGYAEGVADTRDLAAHMAAETHLGEGIVGGLAELTPERVAAAKTAAHADDCTCDECAEGEAEARSAAMAEAGITPAEIERDDPDDD